MLTSSGKPKEFSAEEIELELRMTRQIVTNARMEQAEHTGELLRQALLAVAGLANRWLVRPVVCWYQREQLRHQLAGMDERMLSDIGIARGNIPHFVKEAFKPSIATPTHGASVATLHRLPVDKKPVAANASAEAADRPLAA